MVNLEAVDESKSDDCDYVGGDENISGEDEQIKKYAKLVKRRVTYCVSSKGTGDIVPIDLKIPEVVNAENLEDGNEPKTIVTRKNHGSSK